MNRMSETAKMQGVFVGTLALLFIAVAVGAAPVAVEDAAALYPAPMEETAVRLALPPGSEYFIIDIEGNECGRGYSVESRGAGFSEVSFALPCGWYRLCFPAAEASVGLAVVPDSIRSSYWNIDAGLTWSKWPAERKKQVLNALRRKGISTFRERMSWSQAETDRFGGKTRTVRDTLYHGDALELFHDSPPELRLEDGKNSFLLDFVRSADSIRRMEAGFGNAWNAVELWNEPFYNGALPADQYVPVAKLFSAMLNFPVCGGSFTPAISYAYLNGCLESGFADVLDAFSIHFYGAPESMKDVVSYYRTRLQAAGRGSMPVWVTESGTPDPTLRGAVTTAMRAVECRSLGVERFYAFYLQQYREGKIEWGMSDESGTPQPALACYLAAAALIGNKVYNGDVNVQGDVSIVRSFADKSGSVLVLYGKPGVRLGLPVVPEALAGADGRKLPFSGNEFCNADGLAYAVYAPGKLESVLIRNTVNREFFQPVGNAGQRRKPSVILQPLYPTGQVLEHSNNGYVIEPDAAENFTAVVISNNLTGTPVAGTLAVELPGGEHLTKKLILPANGGIKSEFKVNFRAALENDGECVLRFSFTGDNGEKDRIVQRFQRPASVRSERLFLTDSHAPDWTQAKVFRDTTVCSDVPGSLDVPPDEFSSEAQFLWSDVGIHFRVTVRDLHHEPGTDDGSCWMYDSLQLAVSQYNSINDNNRFEWGFWLDAKGEARKVTFLTSTGKELSEDSEISICRDENAHTTRYEGVIAWSDLGSMNAIYNRERMRLRLTFCVNDCNNGNRRWSEWTPGIATQKNTDSFVEFTLVNGAEVLTVPLRQGVYRGEEKDCTYSDGVLKLNDAPNGKLEFQLPPVRLDSPVTLNFELAATGWREHNGTGFCFGAELLDSGSMEAYVLQIAPNEMFGGKTGYILQEKGAPAPVLGTVKKVLSPSGLFHRLSFTVDPGMRKFELAVTPPGGPSEVVVSGPVCRNTMRSFDRIVFTTSGWGAGPFLLKDVSLVH